MLAAAAWAAPRLDRDEEEVEAGRGGAGAGNAMSGDEVTPIFAPDDLEALPEAPTASLLDM